MVRSITVALIGGFILSSGVVAKEGTAPDSSFVQQRVPSLLGRVESLQRQVEKLDHFMEFPARDQLALFLSLPAESAGFKPAHLILNIDRGMDVQYCLKPVQVERIALGAPLRIASYRLDEGRHHLAVTVSGTDAQGNMLVETLEQSLVKADSTLFLELKLAVSANGDAGWQPSFW